MPLHAETRSTVFKQSVLHLPSPPYVAAVAGLDLENDATAANCQPVMQEKCPLPASKTRVQQRQHTTSQAADQQPEDTQLQVILKQQQAQQQQKQQEPQQQQQQQPQQHQRPGPGQSNCRPGQHGLAPKNWVTPSQMMLHRAGIFYCSSFFAVPGLPKHSESLDPGAL